jgi:Zn-dependent peptidase ImmA (M78 family)
MSRRYKTDMVARQIGQRLSERLDSRVPRDLNRMAKALGVTDILYRTRIRHGYTEWTARGPAIQIALSNTDGRRRSTLAHECGHLILDPLFAPPSFLNAPSSNQELQRQLAHTVLGQLATTIRDDIADLDLEHLCDRLAVEVLLPVGIGPSLARQVDSLSGLKRVANDLRVSLAMLVIRVNEFGGHYSLLQMERALSGDWIVSSAIGVPQNWRGRVISRDLDQMCTNAHNQRQQLTLESRDHTVHVVGNVEIVTKNRAIALLPSRAFYIPNTAPGTAPGTTRASQALWYGGGGSTAETPQTGPNPSAVPDCRHRLAKPAGAS